MITDRLNLFWKCVIVIFTVIGILISINKIFYLKMLGFNPIQNSYLYYILGSFLPISFLIFPGKKKSRKSLRWFDVSLFAITIIICAYLGIQGERIILEGWDWNAPMLATTFSIILWGLLLEALRRTGGMILALVCLGISLYPLISSNVPISFLQGQSYDFLTISRNHIMSGNSVLGIPFTTVGNLIIGFLVFGVVLTFTGGGEFFFKLAQSLFGKTRGGEAKVAIIGSAFLGMLSGSAISNTITTGSMTIPAMKKAGYKPHYAGAIEATSSTGGSITPPIMGSAAFIMASFLAIPYIEIVLAAAVPAILYYTSLVVQADGYAAKNGLKGLPASKVPSLLGTLKEGWFYLIAFFLLLYFLAVLNSEGQAPYYASGALLLIAMIRKETRMNINKMFEMFLNMSKVLTEIICIIAGVGLIVGALSATGVSFSFSRELIAAAGGSTILILIAGAITSFILGMGMTVSAVYVFLAIILAPALVEIGIDPVAAHLFVVFWATASYITPPVALAAFAAAGIAGANAMKTGFTAVRLGIVTFFIPFFFVYQPAILGRGDMFDILESVITAIAGVFILASALEGYLISYGNLDNMFIRIVFLGAGISLFSPGLVTDVAGLVLVLLIYFYKKFNKPVHAEIEKSG